MPLLLSVLVGCNPFAGPDEEVVLIVGSAHFDAGEDISFEVMNHWPEAVMVPVCSDGTPKIVLLRRVSGRWFSAGAQCGFAPSIELAAGGRIRGRRPGPVGAGAEGLYALALHHEVPASFFDDAFGFAGVPQIANSKAFQITD
ncbi:MAG: hypothetical protein OEU54_00940 [Gemmatimonadota bacterium]|nr:hypothetical protein [Gemmatimonadota bacterium]